LFEGEDQRVPLQDGLHGTAQDTLSLPVNYLNLQYAFLIAAIEVLIHNTRGILWCKGVEIYHPVNWDMYG